MRQGFQSLHVGVRRPHRISRPHGLIDPPGNHAVACSCRSDSRSGGAVFFAVTITPIKDEKVKSLHASLSISYLPATTTSDLGQLSSILEERRNCSSSLAVSSCRCLTHLGLENADEAPLVQLVKGCSGFEFVWINVDVAPLFESKLIGSKTFDPLLFVVHSVNDPGSTTALELKVLVAAEDHPIVVDLPLNVLSRECSSTLLLDLQLHGLPAA